MAFEHVLPAQDLEAEQCVLGSMLLDREAIGDVLLVLQQDDFYEPKHAEVFRVLVSLYDRNQPVDLVLVTNELNAAGRLAALGGVDFLVGIMETVPSASHAQAYARLVRESSERRQLTSAAQGILGDVLEGRRKPIDDLLDSAEQRIFAIGQGRSSTTAEPIQSLIRTALERIDAVHMHKKEGKDVVRGLRTHYSALDKMLNGMAPGALYVIAGRPSMGKTSLALNILDHVCVKDAVPSVLFTLEVTKEQVAESLLCSNARVDAMRLVRGELDDREYQKVPEAATRMIQAPLFIDDSPGLTISRMRAKARRLKARHQIGLVVVDYLQLMNLGEYSESRQQEITKLSSGLKHMARELQIPVIALSQLNRSADQRENKRPQMSDLRESGSIEQDADAVLLLYREEYYYPEKLESRGKAEVILAKNRHGPTGRVELFFFPNMMRFENPTFLPEPGGATAQPAAAW